MSVIRYGSQQSFVDRRSIAARSPLDRRSIAVT
jgi:hypothetical protein